MSTAIDKARNGLMEITQRKGQKVTARDIATAHLAIAAIGQLRELADHNLRTYGDALHTSVGRGIQLDATRALLSEIREILE